MLSPVLAVIVPASQGDADVAPVAHAEPAGQSAHAVAPLAGWYEPAVHRVLVLAPAPQYDPSGQSTHAVAPLADWYLPATHAPQLL